MTFLRSAVPDGLEPLLDYFGATYVTGTYRYITREIPARSILRRTPSLYPVNTWNVHDATMSGEARTNNLCESWNSAWLCAIRWPHSSDCVRTDRRVEDGCSDGRNRHSGNCMGTTAEQAFAVCTVRQYRCRNVCVRSARTGCRNVRCSSAHYPFRLMYCCGN